MSLRIRLNVFITLLFLLALVLGVVLVIYNTRHAMQGELVSTANLTLELLGRTLASPNQPDYAYDDSRLFERIKVLENTRHLCVGLYDEAGTRRRKAVVVPATRPRQRQVGFDGS
jgi:two-component system sensor histidine kinase UhpB